MQPAAAAKEFEVKNPEFAPEDTWNTLYGHALGWSSWKGYRGNWFIGGPDGIPQGATSLSAARMWKCTEPGSTLKLTQRNIYKNPPNIHPVQSRSQDTCYEASWPRQISGQYYEPTIRDVTAEGTPGYADRRAIALSVDVHAAAPPAVPTRPLTPADFPPPAADRIQPPGKWSCELFIVDGSMKWSGNAVYDTAAGNILVTALVQERFVEVADLDAPFDFDQIPMQAPRPRLDEDVSSWLPSGRVDISSFGMKVEPESGAFRRVAAQEQQGVAWPPADMKAKLESGAFRLLLLPDAMYLLVPKSLPAFSGQPMHFEFGGIMHSGEGRVLRRTMVQYCGSTGELRSVMHESVKAN